MNSEYWQRLSEGSRITRRRFAGGAATIGLAAAAAGLVGCSSSKNGRSTTSSANTAATSAATAAQSAASAGSTARAASPAAAGGTPAAAAIDSTKGKPGGTLKYMQSVFPPNWSILEQRSPHKFCDHTHSGLLAMHWGTAGVGYDD